MFSAREGGLMAFGRTRTRNIPRRRTRPTASATSVHPLTHRHRKPTPTNSCARLGATDSGGTPTAAERLFKEALGMVTLGGHHKARAKRGLAAARARRM